MDVAWTLGRVEKHPANPLFVPDQPWEGNFDNLYGNIVYDEETQEFKCWYLNFIGRDSSLLYARSKDGIHWEKPALGIMEFNGGKDNNIVALRAHGAGVFKDEREPDPAKRYKMFSLSEEYGWLQVAFSPDGIHWSEQIPQPRISATADTHNNALWAPTLGKYVAFTRQWSRWPYNDQSNTPPKTVPEYERKGARQVARTETAVADDFTTFKRAEVVLEGLDPEHQTYAMPVFFHEGIYLGLLAIFEKDISDRVYTELAWSLDTVHWNRVCPGTALIPNSTEEGAYDYGMVWGCAYPIVRGDDIWIYYGGFDLPHGAKGRRGSLCLATLKKDRWAGYTAKGATGMVLTTPLVWQGDSLWANVDAAGGSVRAELRDETGLVIEGFSADKCKVITEDNAAARVEWNGSNLASLAGRQVQIGWYLTDATLYAFSTGS